MATEAVYEKIVHKKLTVKDYSAVVTGLLLALNLPPKAPWWIAVIGGIFAILVVKQLFGGLGQNFMNPALAARCFLLISFTGRMTDFAVPDGAWGNIVDTVSGATPLAAMKSGETVDLLSLFIGNVQGTIGGDIGSCYSDRCCDPSDPRDHRFQDPGCLYPYIQRICSDLLGDMDWISISCFVSSAAAGLMLGAWFMATDYVTSPITSKDGSYTVSA